MIRLFNHDFGAEAFRQRVDMFCFTDVRLNVTPQQSMELQEQLLRLSDLFTGMISDYHKNDSNGRYSYISIKSHRLSKRFQTIANVLAEQGIDNDALLLFKRELATEAYSDCVNLNDKRLYHALQSFLYKRERYQKQPDPNEPERIN
jgi:hypothetical protein